MPLKGGGLALFHLCAPISPLPWKEGCAKAHVLQREAYFHLDLHSLLPAIGYFEEK